MRAIPISALAKVDFSQKPFEPDDLLPAEQLGLLKCKFFDPNARKLYSEIASKGTAHPRMQDFRNLSERGLCRKCEDARYHRLTRLGLAACDTLIARRFGIEALHKITSTHDDHSIHVCCSCRWSTTISKRGLPAFDAVSRATAAGKNHIRIQQQLAEI